MLLGGGQRSRCRPGSLRKFLYAVLLLRFALVSFALCCGGLSDTKPVSACRRSYPPSTLPKDLVFVDADDFKRVRMLTLHPSFASVRSCSLTTIDEFHSPYLFITMVVAGYRSDSELKLKIPLKLRSVSASHSWHSLRLLNFRDLQRRYDLLTPSVLNRLNTKFLVNVGKSHHGISMGIVTPSCESIHRRIRICYHHIVALFLGRSVPTLLTEPWVLVFHSSFVLEEPFNKLRRCSSKYMFFTVQIDVVDTPEASQICAYYQSAALVFVKSLGQPLKLGLGPVYLFLNLENRMGLEAWSKFIQTNFYRIHLGFILVMYWTYVVVKLSFINIFCSLGLLCGSESIDSILKM